MYSYLFFGYEVSLKKQGKKTKYTLRLIPLGGFVNLEGEEERSDKEGSFSTASIPKRMAIILAGGVVNIIFALIVVSGAYLLCAHNVKQNNYLHLASSSFVSPRAVLFSL